MGNTYNLPDKELVLVADEQEVCDRGLLAVHRGAQQVALNALHRLPRRHVTQENVLQMDRDA